MEVKGSVKTLEVLLILWGAALLTGCNLTRSKATAISNVNVTQAYQTVQARITEIIALTPTRAVTLIPTSGLAGASATPTPLGFQSTSTPTLTLPQGTQTTSCDKAAPGIPIDVTIEDNTLMQPGEKFTKVWRLVNVGTCTWTRQYRAVWFFGTKLGDALLMLMPEDIAPGESVDITVDMVAPLEPGTYQSNWKLSNDKGVLFGIGPNGDLPFWVLIIVVQPATATITETSPPSLTPTQTAIPSITPTPSPTPGIYVAGPASLAPNDSYDLDTNQVDGDGADLVYQTDASGDHWLAPQGGAVLGVYGNGEPNLLVCLSASMSSAPIAIESLSAGSYLCYRTDQGRPGWLRYNSIDAGDGSLSVNILTWASQP
jgi:hypothetical protein